MRTVYHRAARVLATGRPPLDSVWGLCLTEDIALGRARAAANGPGGILSGPFRAPAVAAHWQQFGHSGYGSVLNAAD